MDTSVYEGREQTLVKHEILKKYLERFAHIVGSGWPSITYVDCFSGPWRNATEDFADTSFSIAIEELKKARQDLAQARGSGFRIRCVFIEKDAGAFQKLKEYSSDIKGVELKLIHGSFEDSIGDVLAFIQADSDTFPFLFIDPTGWTGYPLEMLRPLLRLKEVEVLVNFMTKDIIRFWEKDDEGTEKSFAALYGSTTYRDEIRSHLCTCRGIEDACVAAYSAQLAKAGGFSYVASAIVLNPTKARTHFHLIYATRSRKGLEVFKAAEKKAMEAMERARGEIRRKNKYGDDQMFIGGLSPVDADSEHYTSLREQCLYESKCRIQQMLSKGEAVTYDEAWCCALKQPLTWESDLKDWLKEWQKSGAVVLVGMEERQRVPQRGQGIHLRWGKGAS